MSFDSSRSFIPSTTFIPSSAVRAALSPVGVVSGKRSRIADALDRLAPTIPEFERDAILDHALDSRGLSTATPENAAWLSMVSYVRHVLTDYDALLAEGYDRDSARHFVAAETTAILDSWGCRRRIED
ncbi:DUF2293 domain-containing protein [Salinarimonas ramus]|uniref:DUF2293 domain-containing protein n=1 Tax=Salinarimonas ramus TaxID=690164 RepID=A0A917V308_9HYPH|nr:DUF2293 domain-containing protein [Salinarimonas ramus]GGK27776.1 hypothetical protein GCM10011322_12910 [Salinarimonas ramus]